MAGLVSNNKHTAIFTQNLKAVTDSQTNDASNGKELLSHQLLMLEDDPGIGNMHFIQKTFQGVIEVSEIPRHLSLKEPN